MGKPKNNIVKDNTLNIVLEPEKKLNNIIVNPINNQTNHTNQTNQIIQTNQLTQPNVKPEELSETNTDLDNPITKLYLETISNLEKIKDDINKNMSNIKKMYKIALKHSQKQTKRSGNKTKNPSGFGKSTVVPSTLKTLLKITENELPRPTLTKKLNDYIIAHNLKCPTNGRILRVNEELAKALKLTPEQVLIINNTNNDKDKAGLNFYNVQKWIKKLYESDQKITNVNENKQLDKPVNQLDNQMVNQVEKHKENKSTKSKETKVKTDKKKI
jgi:hypothetical protein